MLYKMTRSSRERNAEDAEENKNKKYLWGERESEVELLQN